MLKFQEACDRKYKEDLTTQIDLLRTRMLMQSRIDIEVVGDFIY